MSSRVYSGGSLSCWGGGRGASSFFSGAPDELHLVERLLRRAKTRFVPLELARELAGVRRAARMQDGEVQQRRVAAATRDQSLDRRR